MNEYVTAMRSVSAGEAPEPVCMVIVGGRLNQGGRTCGHAAGDHYGPSYDARCRECEREGVGPSVAIGPRKQTGFDHAFLDRMPPRPAGQNRSAA
jgi:hypothetical protein